MTTQTDFAETYRAAVILSFSGAEVYDYEPVLPNSSIALSHLQAYGMLQIHPSEPANARKVEKRAPASASASRSQQAMTPPQPCHALKEASPRCHVELSPAMLDAYICYQRMCCTNVLSYLSLIPTVLLSLQ